MSHPSPGEEDSQFSHEISKTKKAKKTVNLDPNPNSYPSKLPYPERMKVREHDKPSAQYSRFLKMFKQLRLEIGLKDALVEMPKSFSKFFSSPVKISDNFCEDHAEELAPLDSLANRKEGYFDSEGDIAFLDNLLSDDDSHNLDSEVISDHEPEQNESSITFSPRSDPLHHEFADSEPTQEEIDILLVPDDLIPPGVEDADSEDEVNESPNLDHQDDPSIPRPPPEPPDIKKCFGPKAGIVINKEFKGVSKSHDFMTSILPTLVSDLPFISSIVSFENEDTIFDPGISI
ncbi:hypothetical protein Tco_0127876 [Tanacetum coccineum]